MSSPVDRRVFCLTTAGAVIAALSACRSNTRKVGDEPLSLPESVTIVEFSNQGVPGDTVDVKTIVKSDDDWMSQLGERSFLVLRKEGTEPAFTGQYATNHDAGLYRCLGCDTALFSSETKFESGTGWPSFYQPLAQENIIETADSTLGMMRTKVSCRRCVGHLGHVFTDGPQPTGLRYCLNSASLNFKRFS